MISFVVEGIPRPQGSKRHVGGGRMVESSKHVAGWREFARFKAVEGMRELLPVSGPVFVTVLFQFARPKKHYNSKGIRQDAPLRHIVKPDADKLLRALMDAMTGVVFRDDSQVAGVLIDKVYGETSATRVKVEAL